MWPADTNLGPQLTYGLLGNGVVVPTLEGPLRPVVHFPRLRDRGPMLHKINNSTVVVEPDSAQEPEKPSPYARYNKWVNGLASAVFVEEAMADTLSAESQPLLEDMSHDPSFGKLSTVVDLGTSAYSNLLESEESNSGGKVPLQGLVYAVGGILTVVPLLPKRKKLFTTEKKLIRKVIASTPSHAEAVSIDVGFPIKQIESAKKLIMVRGATKILLLSCQLDGLRPSITEEFELPCLDLPSHVQLGDGKFVLVTGEECTLYKITKENGAWSYLEQKSVSIPRADPTDLSIWRRVCWTPDPNDVTVFSRKAANKVSFEDASVQTLISTHYFSHLQDVVAIGRNTFLLTSRELIWLENTDTNPLKRVLSWKHYLDDADCTFQLSVCPQGDAFICITYSETSPIFIVYTLGFNNGLPCLLRDPYMLETSSKGMKYASLFENSSNPDLMSIVETGLRGGVVISTLSKNGEGSFKAGKPAAERLEMPSSLIGMTTKEALLAYEHYTREGSSVAKADNLVKADNLAKAVAKANDPERQPPISLPIKASRATEALSEQIDVVQQYAYDLGADIRQVFKHRRWPGYLSLSAIAERIPLDMTDFDEFDSMLQQLEPFYESENLSLLHDNMDSVYFPASSSKNLYEHMKEYLESGRQEATVLLSTSSFKAYRNDLHELYEQMAAEEINDSPSELQDIFEDWGSEEVVEPQQMHQQRAESAPPAIGLSQSGHSQKKSGLLRRALTQNSQMRASQVAASESQNYQDTQDSQDTQDIDLGASQIEPLQSLMVESLLLWDSQYSSQSQVPAASSQSSQKAKRPASQTPSQKRKKKRGGFA